MRRFPVWSWFWFLIGLLYFFIPLVSTLEFSLRMLKGRYTLEAYRVAFQDPRFYQSFGYSLLWAVITIVISLLLVVPTAYWVQLKLPKARPYVEFVTLMPFVVPAVVLTFGLIRLYGRPPLVLTTQGCGNVISVLIGGIIVQYFVKKRVVAIRQAKSNAG